MEPMLLSAYSGWSRCIGMQKDPELVWVRVLLPE